ncbi:carboxymuconolactone decarboxylase family protein [Saccharibacillus sp. VR-M41]|uniref:Carboxymuconolactone decarboxylase family protein n=2 Tax=Saccharibacillus alkalitolerans TaxID=2705290 RepID=A0ABX0F2W1_9BACL|nr:carboxymuconolactone decarboxylase family protein [Saccharibacillus alkalitolerans]
MIDSPPVWLQEPVQSAAETAKPAAADAPVPFRLAEPKAEHSLKNSAGHAYADISPAFADYTQRVLFGEVWPDPALSLRDRSLITLAALVTAGNDKQLPYHLELAQEHGLSRSELSAVCTHLAFYAGWPRAASALAVLEREWPAT